MTEDPEFYKSEVIAYYKEHREYAPPIHVCMVGGYYAVEDLPSISDECLDTMLGQSYNLVELFGRLSNKCTVKNIKKTFADTL